VVEWRAVRAPDRRRKPLNPAVILALSAGLAIASQVVINTLGIRSLGVSALIGVSGLATALAGFAAAFLFAKPEFTARALIYGAASGLVGAFILASVVIAAARGGLAQTLSLVIASQLVAGLLIDRAGFFGAAAQDIGIPKVLGVALIVAGGVLVVRY